MTLGRGDFIIKVEFSDNGEISLGGADEIYLTPAEGSASFELNDDILNLIHLLQKAEQEATS